MKRKTKEVFLGFRVSLKTVEELIIFISTVMNAEDLVKLRREARKMWKKLNPSITKE